MVIRAVDRVEPRGLVNTALVSDTILLWTEDPENQAAAMSVAMAMGNLFRDFLEAESIPLCGAMTLGDLHVDRRRNLFVGASIVEAYLWEKKQDWLGAIVTPSLEPTIRGLLSGAPPWAEDLFIAYPAPLKDGHRQVHLCIDWLRDFRNWPVFLNAAFFPLGQEETTHPIFRKFRNTADFCEFCAARREETPE